MAAIGVPHLAFPPAIGGDKHLQMVEQDSEEDIMSCVYVALKTPLGSRFYVSNFGVSDYTFYPAVPLIELEGEVQVSEPRASVELAGQINELIERIVMVGVNNVA